MLFAAVLAVDFSGRQLEEGEISLPPSVSFTCGGTTRSFLHQAATPANSGPYALIIDLHGRGGQKEAQWEIPTWRLYAPTRGIVVVWPDGVTATSGTAAQIRFSRGWNAGQTWCGAALSQQSDDVGFIDEVITRVSAIHSIDLSRIYISGHSCGCSMA